MKYWQNGFYLEQNETKTRIEISDNRWEELLNGQSNGLEIYTRVDGQPDMRQHISSQEEIIQDLRFKRETECFNVINRGQLWYDTLSPNQKQDLHNWYHAWLDVTVTKIIPVKPYWLN